jgi:hypothetical protein
MRWRITIRSDDTELRGYIDAPLSDLERFAEAVKPLGLMIASPADLDYDPFREVSPNDGSRPP